MKRIALATYTAHPTLETNDGLLYDALAELGIKAEATAWNDKNAEWSTFDAVVLRSCWDYHLHPAEFKNWILYLKSKAIPLWNDPKLVIWNMHKSYLLDLGKDGVRTVPTILLESPDDLNKLLEEKNLDEIVIKPAVGASGYKIVKTSMKDMRQQPEVIEKMLVADNVLVQPFIKEASETGEFSSIYFNGVHSHTVLKQPKSGDFRSNYEHGAVASNVSPDRIILKKLQPVLDSIRPIPLYARVDYLIQAGEPLLMELELIEPNLYLDLWPPSAKTFAELIINRV